MAKRKNNSWIIAGSVLLGLIIIAAVIFYGARQGWFSADINVGDTNINLNSPPVSMEGKDCEQSLDKEIMCVGDLITGEVKDGQNSMCLVYGSRNNGKWTLILNGSTDYYGVYTESDVINIAGNYRFRSICDYNNNGYFDVEDCVTEIDELIVTTDSPPCPFDEGEEETVYTCGQGTDEGVCQGTCPSTHPECVELEFEDIIRENYFACACINEDAQEVHPDWKPDGQYHNIPEDDPLTCDEKKVLGGYQYAESSVNSVSDCNDIAFAACTALGLTFVDAIYDGDCCLADCGGSVNFNELEQEQLKIYIVNEYPAADISCTSNSDCPSTMKCWGGGLMKCRYTCYDSDPTQIQNFLGYCVDASKTLSDAENYFRTDRCALGALVQDQCEPDGSYTYTDGSQVYSCEPVNYGACGCDFGVC